MGNKTRHTANLVSDNNLFVDIANDRVGIGSTQPTAKLNVAGIVSATSFRGDGSQLSGISVDSTSLVDSNSATRVQATTTGAVVTGILTATKFFGDASNVTGIVTTNLGKANVTISDAPPGIGTAHGDLWWESDTAKGHIYYNDGSSAQWVEFNPSSGGGGGGGGGSYGNADVDSHLNTGSASSGQILSWNGSDYAWVADQTGGGSGITTANINADTLNVSGVSTFTGSINANSNVTIGGALNLPATPSITRDGQVWISRSASDVTHYAGSPGSSGGDTIFKSYFHSISGSAEILRIGYGNGGNGAISIPNGTLSVGGISTFSNNLHVGTGITMYASSGIVSATSFSGSGSSLTGLTGASAGTYGDGSNVAAITVDSNGRITGISEVSISGGGGGGISNVVDDTTPQLGGDLDLNSNNISGSGTISATKIITSKWTLGANLSNDYTFTGPGLTGTVNDPTIYLIRGQSYQFANNSGGHPFRIQSTPNGSAGTQYNTGVTNNDANNGVTLTFDVPFDAPDVLYYQCTAHPNMGGKIVITAPPKRFTTSASTGSIAAAATQDITIAGCETYALLKIATSHAAWVRLYTDTTSRTNDASRAYTTDPTPGSGVLAEVYTTTSGSNTFKMTPAVTGWNDDSTPSTNIYAKVTNNESTAQDITVTLTILRMED